MNLKNVATDFVVDELPRQCPMDTPVRSSDDVFVSWSGGKDSAYSCYLAMKSGLNVRYLASMMTSNNGRLFPHYLTPEIIQAQANALDIPLIQQWVRVPDKVTREKIKVNEYDDSFIDMLQRLKSQGISKGVFGVVSAGNRFAAAHRAWVESVCGTAGIEPCLPLWGFDRETIIQNIVEDNFKPIIVVADNHRLGPDYLGRVVDKELLAELKARFEASPDGKVGLYHTFMIDGPIFQKRLEIDKAEKIMVEGIWYLDIQRFHLTSKPCSNPFSTAICDYGHALAGV